MDQAEYKRPKRPKRRKHNNGIILNIILCIICLSALTGCIILLLENKQLKQAAVETMAGMEAENMGALGETIPEPEAIEASAQESLWFTEEESQALAELLARQAAEEAKDEFLGTLKEKVLSGEGVVNILRFFYPEDVIVYAEGEYHFIPISETLKKHEYRYENFIMDDQNILTYQDENGNPASQKGIDVSKYQGSIDWRKVAGDGVKYAFIRLGIRGSSEGKLVLDETYEDNMAGAAANNIDTGVYFFTQALNEEEAREEAEFVLDAIKDYQVTYPIVLDVEDVATKNPRTKNMTKEDWTKVTIAFCERIKAAGYEPMIYGNLKTFMLMLDMEQLEQYEKWYAYYSAPLYFPYEFSIWQYSSKGSVAGIKGEVDMNVCMKDLKSVINE